MLRLTFIKIRLDIFLFKCIVVSCLIYVKTTVVVKMGDVFVKLRLKSQQINIFFYFISLTVDFSFFIYTIICTATKGINMYVN